MPHLPQTYTGPLPETPCYARVRHLEQDQWYGGVCEPMGEAMWSGETVSLEMDECQL